MEPLNKGLLLLPINIGSSNVKTGLTLDERILIESRQLIFVFVVY